MALDPERGIITIRAHVAVCAAIRQFANYLPGLLRKAGMQWLLSGKRLGRDPVQGIALKPLSLPQISQTSAQAQPKVSAR